MNQKQINLLYKNTLTLVKAFQFVRGDSAFVLKDQQAFVELLSRNGIELSAVLHPNIGD